MKKLFIFFAIAGLIFVGCKDNATGPVDISTDTGLQQANTLSIIKLPESLTPRPMHKKISCLITPKSGGVIHYKDSYNSSNGWVEIDIQLRFQPGSVDEDIIVSVNLDLNQLSGDLAMDFGPSPKKFAKPALLTVEAIGLDPNGLPADPTSIKLVYIETDGNCVPTKTKKIKIDLKKGKLKIQEGELPHFSRYAFIT